MIQYPDQTINRITEGLSVRLPEKCAACLYDHQAKKCSDEAFLTEVRNIIEERDEEDSTAVLVYRIKKVYESFYGKPEGYADVKRRYNDLVLQMESGIRKKIESSEDPLSAALAYARIGNYIDYGAMHNVDEETFLSLFDGAALSEKDQATYESLLRNCEEADTFLLIADNCGEIVLDKLLLEQLKLRFPQLTLQVLVRGEDVLNDVTMEDAAYTGIDRIAQVLSNGKAVAGTVYEMMPQDAQKALDNADVILSKGQGNYESLSGLGRHIFYAFLCKCDYFTAKFQVPLLTGMLVEEAAS